jgi:hypothetical protein
LGEHARDGNRIWRAAFREGYGRDPRTGELDRYKYWHGISRRDGFVGFEPPDWRSWPAKPIPPDAIEDMPAPVAPTEALTTPGPVPEPEPPQLEPSTTDRTDIARSVPAHDSSFESPPAGNGRPRAKERAETFVREQLANGLRYGELVKRDAAEFAKISERS